MEFVGLRAVEPLTFRVLVGLEIDLTGPNRAAHHADGHTDRFVEPRGALLELRVGRRLLRCFLEEERNLPLLVRPHFRAFEAFVVTDGPRHDLAGQRGVGEQSFLPLVGLEGLALFDAERLEHAEHDAVALEHGFFVDDFGQALPVGHSARLFPAPLAAIRRNVPRGRRIFPPAVGINAQCGDRRLRFLRIGIERTMAGPDVHRRRLDNVVALGLDRFVTGAEHEVFPAGAFVGSGLTAIGERPLPEVDDSARHRARRNFDDQRSGFLHVGKGHDIGSRGVGREQAEFVAESQIIDVIQIPRAELGALLLLPLVHGHEGQGPQVGLASALEIDVIVNFFHCLARRISVFQFEFSQTRIHGAGSGKLLREAAADQHGEQNGNKVFCFHKIGRRESGGVISLFRCRRVSTCG